MDLPFQINNWKRVSLSLSLVATVVTSSLAQYDKKELQLVVSPKGGYNVLQFSPDYTREQGTTGFSLYKGAPPKSLIYQNGNEKTVHPLPIRAGIDIGLKRVNYNTDRAWSILLGADYSQQLFSSSYDNSYYFKGYSIVSWNAYVKYFQVNAALTYYWSKLLSRSGNDGLFLRLGTSQAFGVTYIEPAVSVNEPFTFNYLDNGTGSVIQRRSSTPQSWFIIPEVGVHYDNIEASISASVPLQQTFTEQHTFYQNNQVTAINTIGYRLGGVYGTIRLMLPVARFSRRRRSVPVVETSPPLPSLPVVTKSPSPPSYNKGQVVRLNNVYFKASSAELLPNSYAELDSLVKQMHLRPTLRIRLEGHTDIIGEARLNQQLSEERVGTIQQYMTSKGIESRRIGLKGYGDKRPLKRDCPPPTGCPENRRVEFLILSD